MQEASSRMQEARGKTQGNSLWRVLKSDVVTACALTLVGLLTRLPYVTLIPLYHDETASAIYALAIKLGGFMPLVNVDPYHGPVFPYLLAASLYLFPSPLTPRIFAMITGALTVGITYGLARAMGLGRPWATLAGLLMTANPIHILINSHLADSSFIIPLFSTAFLAALARAVRRDSGPWLIVAGALLGLAGQAHPTVALMLPGVAVWFLLQRTPGGLDWRRQSSRQSPIGFRTRWPYLAAAVVLLVYAPVIIHNMRTSLAAVQEVTQHRLYAWEPVTSLGMYLQNMWRLALQLCRQVSGVLEGNETFRDLMGLPLLLSAWAVAGLIYTARKGASLPALAVLSQMLVMPGLSSYYGLYLETRYTIQLAPLMFVAMAALAADVWEIMRPYPPALSSVEDARQRKKRGRRRAMAWLAGALLVALSLWPLTLLARYYQHQLAAGRTTAPNYAFVDDVMRQWHGESILISKSLGPFDPTEYIFATQRVPYLAMPLGRIMERLATGQEPGSVILVLDKEDVSRAKSQADLISLDSPAIQAAREMGFGAYAIADAQKVRKPAFVFSDTTLAPTVRPMQANLGDQLVLIGYEPKATQFAPGDRFVVNLYWKATSAMPESYTGFLHLIGPDGRLVTQDDHELGRGFYRTLFWKPDEVVRERYELALPKDTPPGDYALWAGVYGFPSLKRLAVRSASTSAQDDRVWLDILHVGP